MVVSLGIESIRILKNFFKTICDRICLWIQTKNKKQKTKKNGGGGGNRTHVRDKAASVTTCVVSVLQPESVLRPTDIERLRIKDYLSSPHLTQKKASGLSW